MHYFLIQPILAKPTMAKNTATLQALVDTVSSAGEGVVTAVNFTAIWGGPCKKIGSIYDQLARGEEVVVEFKDADGKDQVLKTLKEEFKDSVIFLRVFP